MQKLQELIHNLNKLEHSELASWDKTRKFSQAAILSALYNFKDLFISSEILPPGRTSSAPHFHSNKEELALVLDGNPTVYLGNFSAQLKPGDFIGFPLNVAEHHYFKNLTNQPCHILLISSNPAQDIINYPDKNT